MIKIFVRLITSSLLYIGIFSVQASELEMRGNLELQNRFFFSDALSPEQPNNNLSFAAVPEFFWSWNNRNDSLEFIPSIRIDEHDDERTHADIREFSWVHVADDWESRIGIRRVFWGVTEFQHLVDIINQSDSVEDIDNEDKLGQPMLNLSLVKDWGILDFYILPYFRERTFAGQEGRPNIAIVDVDSPLYESSDEEEHVDWAARWSHSISDYELALSWFQGTSREPLLVPSPQSINQPSSNQTVTFLPFYQQIKQLGFELQANIGDVVFKLESIYNQNDIEDFSAAQTGFEYTQYGIMQSNADLGWLLEYAWDERGKESDLNFISTFQNDLFVGSRLALNDIQSTEVLAGLSYDLDFESSSFLVEASRRFGDNIKILLDIRLFESDDQRDFANYLLRKDDHIQLTAQYFY